MYSLIRSFLFQLNPEQAHTLTLSLLDYIPQYCFKPIAEKPVHAMGLVFPHAVGLAAGLDKNGEHIIGLAKVGFSFIEIGTVTPKPQLGNPQPRLFRLPEAEALINRMGFNNKGVEHLVESVKQANYSGILGINIGKNKETPLDMAAQDYLYGFRRVYAHASYVTINISSPNTPDLRQLQQDVYLSHLLTQLVDEQKRLADTHQRLVPLVVKISPDEDQETLKHMTETFLKNGIQGVIATNTTCSRRGVEGIFHASEQGGLSGKPLRGSSTACLRLLKQYLGDELTLIGVGGIDSVESAQEKLEAGASLIQLYSGLIYQGPSLVGKIASSLTY